MQLHSNLITLINIYEITNEILIEAGVIEDDDGKSFGFSYSGKSIHNDINRFMVSWWVTDSYFNIEQIQMADIEIMTAAYGSSGPFGSRVRSKYIGHNTYTGRRSNLRSKPTPIHGPVHK